MIDTYTRLLEATAELEDKAAADAAITKFIAHMKSAGRMKMLPRIVHELRKIASRRIALMPRVEVAHEGESATALVAAASEGIVAEHASINSSLISGWRARGNGKLIDRSAKSALVQIYQKVTA